jgi:hypothetical protein
MTSSTPISPYQDTQQPTTDKQQTLASNLLSTTDVTTTAKVLKKSPLVSSKRRRLYPMAVQSSSASSSAAASGFLSAGCCLGFRRQACLLGALAAFQTVAVVTIIVSALGEAGSGARLTSGSIIASGSGYGGPSGFIDRFNSRLGGIALGIPPPSSLTDELNVTNELNVTLIEMQSVLYNADCVETFLLHYEQFCQSVLVPHVGNNVLSGSAKDNVTDSEPATSATATAVSRLHKPQMELCPCVPRQRLSKSEH